MWWVALALAVPEVVEQPTHRSGLPEVALVLHGPDADRFVGVQRTVAGIHGFEPVAVWDGWDVTGFFHAPDVGPMFGADSDGDGHEELWLRGVDTAYQLSDQGDVLATYDLPPTPWTWYVPYGGPDRAALADLDGDGALEFAVFTGPETAYEVAVVELDGTVRWSTPVTAQGSAAMFLRQSDGDPQLEILVGSDVLDGLTGVSQAQRTASADVSSQALGDVDGDGAPDLLERIGNQWTVTEVHTGRTWSLPARVRSSTDWRRLVDVDGDGVDELVVAEDRLEVWDVRTASLVPWFRDHQRSPCARDVYLYRPAPGQRRLVCRYNGAVVDDTGRLEEVLPRSEFGRLAAGDVDGDGVAEVVSVGKDLRVFDGDGTLLEVLRAARQPVGGVDDVDGDGDLELFTTLDAVRTYDWVGPGQVVPTGTWLPLVSPLVNPRLLDLDANGVPDVLYSGFGPLKRIDLSNGAQQTIGTSALTKEPIDLDDDGIYEIVTGSNRPPAYVYDLAGNVLAQPLGFNVSLLGGPGRRRLISSNNSVAVVHRFANGSLIELARHQMASNTPIYAVAEDLFVYTTDAGVVVWRAGVGDVAVLRTGLLPVIQPLLHDSALWLSSGNMLERWELPTP
jgi:hypothetical protein